MKVYIETSAMVNGNSVRGVGYYTQSLINALKQYRPDITLVDKPDTADLIHYPYFDLYFLTLPLYNPKPLVVTIHDTIPLIYKGQYPSGVKGQIRFFIQSLALKQAKRILTVSETSKKDIIHYLHIPASQIHVTYQAVSKCYQEINDDQKQAIRLKYHLPEKFILYVGDVNYNKNIPRLIEAFAKVENPSLDLVLVGKAFLDSSLKEIVPINRCIEQLQKQNQIHKLGFVPEEDMPALFGSADLYIQPSLYEGFGIPVLQAIACKTPVTASNTPALREVGGEAVFYFNPHDITDIKAAIETLDADQSLREKNKAAGLKRAAMFSLEHFAKNTARAYEDALERI